MKSTPSLSETEEPAQVSACPTPLGWKKVVSTFEEEATTFHIPFKASTLTGKTWGTGPPLILIGGLTSTPKLFSLLVYLLHEEFTCILFEPSDPKLHTPVSLSEELLAVADHHQAETFHIYASGLGSVTALTVALNHPHRISKMILHSGFANRNLSWTERFLMFWGKFLPGRLCSLPGFRSVFVQNHLRWFPPFDASRWQFLDAEVGEQPIKQIAKLASVLKKFDVRNRLKEIMHDLLLLRTEGDGAVLESHQQELSSALPNVQEERLQHTGYMVHLTHPHRVAKIVRPFLIDELEN